MREKSDTEAWVDRGYQVMSAALLALGVRFERLVAWWRPITVCALCLGFRSDSTIEMN